MNKFGNPKKKNHLLTNLVVIGSALFATVFFIHLVMELNHTIKKPKQESRTASFDLSSIKQKPKPKKKKTERQKPKPKPKHAKPLKPSLNLDVTGFNFQGKRWNNEDYAFLKEGLGGDSDAALSSDAVDELPRVRFKAPVNYPSAAQFEKISGYVLLNLLIDSQGNVKKMKVIEAEPKELFEYSAMQSVQQWKFEPAKLGGNNVDVWAQQRVRFELN